MATIDQINNMRQQGMDDSSIINNLQQQGLSPREINDGLSQSQIRSAVQGEPQNYGNGMEGMQPSIGSQPNTQQEQFQGMPQEGPYAQELSAPTPTQENYGAYEQSNESYDQNYGSYDQGYGYSQGDSYGANTETVSEISSQIVDQKMKKINKTMDDLTEVQTLLTSKVEKIDQRLDKIEKLFDQLQIGLLRKSSDQEQNIEDIKTEMGQMQEGFSKVIHPLMDIERNLSKVKKTTRKTSKKK